MGLGTSDADEANRLVEQINELLSNPAFWEASARPRAEQQFDHKIVDIFFHGMAPEPVDFFAVRDGVIQLPSSDSSDYRRMLFVGTTGGGKTTLVRQLLGTHPTGERFPSTSTARTTVAEMEFVLTDDTFRAAVTFLPYDQVVDYVQESISAAVLAAYYRATDSEILRKLLHHVSQRFRLNYILGNGGAAPTDADIDDEDELTSPAAMPVGIDLHDTNVLLKVAIERVRALAEKHGDTVRSELNPSETDERIIEEIFEDNLDYLLREDDDFHEIADNLIEAIEQRFDALAVGTVQKTKQGWPRTWSWETSERPEFIRTVSRFTSNYAPHFGTLLTPLVNGIRVAGPFKPEWLDRPLALVILDGEGLGHTAESATSLPTSITRRFEDVDAVLLVDNATQPMQATAVAVLRGLATSGKSSKLFTCFTHFDEVKGDNLPTFKAKEDHVLGGAENVLPAIGEQLGPFAERALRKRLAQGCFFVGGIHEPLDPTSKRGSRTIEQLRRLVEAIETSVKPRLPVKARPTYDRMNLVLAVKDATETFHEAWRARLGYEYRPDMSKAPWQTVKALTRRLAEGWADEWAYLRPIADLHSQLEEKIYVFIQNPIHWAPEEPGDDEKQEVFEGFADAISQNVLNIAARRLRDQRVRDWQDAYNQRGIGSTFVRAAIIKDKVYAKAAPVPGIAPSPGKNKFLREVLDAVETASEACEITLR
jgi:hypothetical protein